MARPPPSQGQASSGPSGAARAATVHWVRPDDDAWTLAEPHVCSALRLILALMGSTRGSAGSGIVPRPDEGGRGTRCRPDKIHMSRIQISVCRTYRLVHRPKAS